MNETDFLANMTDYLEADEKITMDDLLSDTVGWDSVALVSFLSMANVTCGKNIAIEEIRNAQCIGDLFHLLQK